MVATPKRAMDVKRTRRKSSRVAAASVRFSALLAGQKPLGESRTRKCKIHVGHDINDWL